MPFSRAVGWMAELLKDKRRPNSWSLSAYNDYAECPAKYALNRVVKLCTECGSREGKKYVGGVQRCVTCDGAPKASAAIDRGTEIHMKAEQYLLGNTRGLPTELEKFSDEFGNLRRVRAQPEASWTLSKDFKSCEADDWDRAWLRMKIDTHVYYEDDRSLVLIDYKTGQIKPQENQAEVYALSSPVFYPQVEEVQTEFWWTSYGEVTKVPKSKPWTRKQLDELKKKWWGRAESMLSDVAYVPRPGDHCKWCAFRSNRTLGGKPGPCTAWKQV